MADNLEFWRPLRGEGPALAPQLAERLAGLSACLRSAKTLDEAFDLLASGLAADLPFDRLGLAVVTDDGHRLTSLRVRSRHALRWNAGDSRPLLGSSLEAMIRERSVRIIHDLKRYQHLRPSSLSTKRLIEEGMRSSIALPIAGGERPLGVLFLTSVEPDTYHAEHARLLTELSPTLDQAFGRLLAERTVASPP
jgi:GAF domain-containing protein